MVVQIILLLVVIIYCIFYVSQSYNIIFKGNAPFISTDNKSLKQIINEIEVKENSIIYELGCGRAKFLRILEKNHSKLELVGIENLFSLYILDKILFFLLKSKIKFFHQDLFKTNLNKADIIYCWLFDTTMKRLGEKIISECRPGTQIISRSFSISQLTPTKTITIRNKQVYFYKL